MGGTREADTTATAPAQPGDSGDARFTPPASLGHFSLGGLLGSGGMGMVFGAHDTVLDRPVALKLVRPDSSSATARVRLVREGKALARLSHPNVVTVYEISAVGDKVFIVMELVDGTTLREWMQQARPWRDVVRVFIAAGRGLLAAHALGLVHRDFKPSNVLIDHNGAVKVSDFGLVGAAGDEPPGDEPPPDAGAMTLTRTGAVMGTPAYMAPEQLRGERLDARADQFAFCLSLYEALTGTLTPDRRSTELDAGRDHEPPRPLPRRLRSILMRGMSQQPDARFPSLRELLVELERAAAPRRWPWVALALLVGGGAAAGVARRPDPCPPPSFAGVWDAARRAALQARLAALDPGDGMARFTAAAGLLDGFVNDLSSMQVSSCRATRMQGTQSDTLFDLRTRCLERRRDELSAATALVLDARDRAQLDHAVAALAELPPAAPCADGNGLQQAAPEKPRDRQLADEILRERASLETLRRAGRLDGLLPRAQALVAKAESLHHGPSLSAALSVLAVVQLERGEKAAGRATLERLTQVAASAHDDAAAAMAWTRLVGLIGDDQGKPKEALALMPAARAAVVRAGNDTRQAVELLYNEAIVLGADGTAPLALARLDEARRILVAAGADGTASPLTPRLADVELESANEHAAASQLADADAAYRRAIALYRRAYGPDHPDEAYAWHNLGETLRRQDKLDAALDAYRQAARIRESRQGETPLLAATLVSIGATLNATHKWREAVAPLERALAILRAGVPAGDPALVPGLLTTGTTYSHVGRIGDARQAYDEAIAIGEKTGATKTNLAITVYNRGELEAGAHRWPAALADYRRALAWFEATPTTQAYDLIYPLLGIGRAEIELGHAADAIGPLTRAIALDAPGEGVRERAAARVWLGRALVETGRDRARGRALMRAGRDELARLGPGAVEDLRDAEAMIARVR